MAIDPLEVLAQRQAARNGTGAYAVTFTDDKPPNLVLPEVPEHDDPAGLCAWLTSVLRLNPEHPVTGAVHQGVRGPDGHVEIRRADAPEIRFEPVAAIYTPRRLFPMLATQLTETDGEPYGFKEEHARRIAHVIRLLCGAADAMTADQETAGIIGTFLSASVPVEGHTTYGATAERYAAALALRAATWTTTPAVRSALPVTWSTRPPANSLSAQATCSAPPATTLVLASRTAGWTRASPLSAGSAAGSRVARSPAATDCAARIHVSTSTGGICPLRTMPGSHVTTRSLTITCARGNRDSLTCREVDLCGYVATATCALVDCSKLACNARTCECPTCACETCLLRRLKATFNATELPDG